MWPSSVDTINSDCLNSRLKYRPRVKVVYKLFLIASLWLLFRSALYIRKLNINLFSINKLTYNLSIPTHAIIVIVFSGTVALYSLSQFFNNFKNAHITWDLSWNKMHERKSYRSIKSRSEYLTDFISKQIPQPNLI